MTCCQLETFITKARKHDSVPIETEINNKKSLKQVLHKLLARRANYYTTHYKKARKHDLLPT